MKDKYNHTPGSENTLKQCFGNFKLCDFQLAEFPDHYTGLKYLGFIFRLAILQYLRLFLLKILALYIHAKIA